jgi:hypothetical protein
MYASYLELIIKFFIATGKHISNLEHSFFTLKKSLSQLSSNESKTKHIAIKKLV